MRKFFFFLILSVTAGLQVQSQAGKSIDVTRLVRITETSDFSSLVKLVKELSYVVLDSSRLDDGTLFYYSREMKLNGNVLACSVNPKRKIDPLTFSTTDSATYINVRKQVLSLGFKSSGKSKGRIPGVLETEDFEKGKLLIAMGSRRKENDAVEYEFTFMLW